MWSSRLFWKLFLAYAALVVLIVSTCSAIIAGWQEEQLVEQVRRRLRDTAILLQDQLDATLTQAVPSELQTKVRRLGELTSTRITLVNAEGTVLADSNQPTLADVETMDNHLSREEFAEAKHDGTGSSRRLSSTLKTPFLYYTVAISDQDEIVGYVRAAEPIVAILDEVKAVQRLIGLVGLTVGVTGLIVAYLLTRRIVQPIQTLTAIAEEMAVGKQPKNISIKSNDEIGLLALSFQRMVERLGRREYALRESADRQSAVLTGMNDGVLAVDNSQHVLFANVAAGKLVGFNPVEAEGQPLLEVIRSNDLREIVVQSLTTKKLTQGEIKWKAETLHTLNVNAAPLPGDPCPGVVLVLHDITEVKRLEGLRQQFVANVSHELKTPLSSIKAYTETLLGGAWRDQGNAERFLSRIDEQADRLHELVLDMLSLARIEAGELALDLVDLPLSRVAIACVADHDTRAKSSQLVIENEIADSSLCVRADEDAVQQILSNLLDNALKYTPAGGKITLRCQAADSNRAIIEVVDTGLGISQIHHARLFERFYRVDKARSRELGGTGLGLAIVKHLCQAMDGSVSVESQLGSGSIFRVQLPLA